jgi:diguanylate cyclase (GGDEF)-like protein
MAATVAVQIASDRERDLAEARTRLDNLTRLLAHDVTRTLDGIDRTLTAVKAMHERNLSSAPMETLFDAFGLGGDAERSVALFDRGGRLVATAGTGAARAIWDAVAPSDVANASMHQGPQLRVLRAVRVRGDGERFVIPVVKRLDATGGEFDGAVASAIDASRLLSAYRDLRTRNARVVGLAFADGRVAAIASSATRQPLATDELDLPPIRAGGETSVEWRALGARRQLVGARAAERSGLAVFASLDEAEIFASNRLFATSAIGFLAVALALVTLPLAFVARRALRELYRHHRLAAASAAERAPSRTDPLTGIGNRAAFDEHLKNCHVLLARYGKPFVLAFLDVDRFAAINEAQGREAGDRALRRLAITMQDAVRETDLVARLGDDQFAILMPGARVASVRRAFEQLRTTLGVDAAIGGWPISFSVGVVAFESAPPRPVDAFNFADGLMHEVKAAGRDGIRYAVYRNFELLSAAHAAAV